MATLLEVYAKFGVTAETAQLFETELSTLLLGVHAVEKGWHIKPDPESALKLSKDIDNQTLGSLLKRLRLLVEIDDSIEAQFDTAWKARNRLMHGFYEKHNFKIHTNEGRDLMIADLEALHTDLSHGWNVAGLMTKLLGEYIYKQMGAEDGLGDTDRAMKVKAWRSKIDLLEQEAERARVGDVTQEEVDKRLTEILRGQRKN